MGPSTSFSLPPGLVRAKAHFSPSDRSRKARIAKDHCVRFAQNAALEIATRSSPLSPLPQASIATFLTVLLQASQRRAEQDLWSGNSLS